MDEIRFGRGLLDALHFALVRLRSGLCKSGIVSHGGMTRFRRPRLILIFAFLAAVAFLAAGVWSYGYRQALGQAASRGEADLALAADRLVTQLVRYRETAVLLSDHPVLDALHAGGSTQEADALLLEAVDKTAALTAFYVDTTGQLLATAHSLAPADLVETAYFARAMQGALGYGHGISSEFNRRAYYFAAPSFGPLGFVQGALIVAVDIDNLEQDWRGSRPAVLFTDSTDLIFVTNRSELLFWRHVPGGLVAPDAQVQPIYESIVDGYDIWRQTLSPYVPQRALHLEKDLPVIGMVGEALIDTNPARRLAWLQAAVVAALCLSFGAVIFVVAERRRTLSEANAVLEDRVAARTRALQNSNSALRREVAERQEAEAALKRVQADLVQAGKLSALGHMSAGISHELNQPLMAIRSFAENGMAFIEKGKSDRAAENLGRISDMARRMGRIIKNLRAFARQESEPLGRVDLRAVLDSTVEMTEIRLKDGNVTLHYDRPEHPIWVRGGEVRLGQVFVNLISNAADAMAESETRQLKILVGEGPPLSVQVRDTGPGIKEPEKIFDPFYTTKAVGGGEGMGLGLSISYGLVQSFGGTIRGANALGGGSVFSVELEPWKEDKVA